MNTAIAKAGGIGTAAALVLTLIAYLVADAVSGPLLVSQPGSDTPEEVRLGIALVFVVLGGAIGIVFALIANRLRRPAPTFAAVCVVALVLYGIMPFTAAEDTSTAIWLNVMHLAAAVPIVGLLTRVLPSDRDASAHVETEASKNTAT